MQARRSSDVKQNETSEKYFHEMTEILEKSKCQKTYLTVKQSYLHAIRFRAVFWKRIVWLYGNWAHLFIQVW